MSPVRRSGRPTRRRGNPSLPVGRRGTVNADRGAPTRTAPRRLKPGPKPKPKPTIVITSFRARGSVENRFRKSPGGLIEKERAREKYFEIQSEAPPGFPNSPGIWASNEGLFLGQVNFPGRVKRSTLERMLNEALNLIDNRGRVHKFQSVYRRWEVKWQVFEKYPDGSKRIVERFKDSQ